MAACFFTLLCAMVKCWSGTNHATRHNETNDFNDAI